MTSQCERGLGWPEDPPVDVRAEIVADLEEMREEVAPDWGPKRGTWNFAILIAKGRVKKRKQ